MKIKKKRKSRCWRFLFSAIIASQILVLLKTETVGEAVTSKIEIENETDTEMEIEIETEIHEIDSLDDIIITYSEEGYELSEKASNTIENIFEIENESLDTGYFCITEDSVEIQFVGYDKEDEVDYHVFNRLYNKENDTIDWVAAAEVIYLNSLDSLIYTAMPIEDVEYILDSLKEYIENIKSDFSEINMEEIACKLSTFSLLYARDKYPTLAGTAKDYIVYYDSDGNIKTFDPDNSTSRHEFFHFLCFGCSCKMDFTHFTAEGLNISNPTTYRAENGELKFYSIDDIYGISYTFIEESLAERNVYTYNRTSPTTYFSYQKITDNIELALSINENYVIDEYVSQCIYRKPIDFIRNFPVGNENSEENFTDNVRMLIIYDALLRCDYDNEQYLLNCLAQYETEEEKDECIANLINYSQSQLTKLFFSNLVVLNEQHSEENLHEYYAYLIRLFDQRMQQANKILLNEWGLSEDFDLVTEEYNRYFNDYKTHYLSYLISCYPSEYQDIMTIYNDLDREYDIFENKPIFLNTERVRLYSILNFELSYPSIYDTIPRMLNLTRQG